jgi:hypothetical protein
MIYIRVLSKNDIIYVHMFVIFVDSENKKGNKKCSNISKYVIVDLSKITL